MNFNHTPSVHTLNLFFFLSVFAMGACQSDKTENAQTNIAPSQDSTCYLYVQNRDSIKLSIQQNEGSVTGTLAFLFYEKDKSRGTLSGEIKGDTLFANYTFTSEGMLSYREVAFLKRDDTFVMGTGQTLNTGNRDVFQNHEGLQFDNGILLKQVPACN